MRLPIQEKMDYLQSLSKTNLEQKTQILQQIKQLAIEQKAASKKAMDQKLKDEAIEEFKSKSMDK